MAALMASLSEAAAKMVSGLRDSAPGPHPTRAASSGALKTDPANFT